VDECKPLPPTWRSPRAAPPHRARQMLPARVMECQLNRIEGEQLMRMMYEGAAEAMECRDLG
jgi:hypothetical protein